jgi:chromate transporter
VTTQNKVSFTAPLTAITAAVDGVILHLGLFFGYHVLWSLGLNRPFEWSFAVIAV